MKRYSLSVCLSMDPQRRKHTSPLYANYNRYDDTIKDYEKCTGRCDNQYANNIRDKCHVNLMTGPNSSTINWKSAVKTDDDQLFISCLYQQLLFNMATSRAYHRCGWVMNISSKKLFLLSNQQSLPWETRSSAITEGPRDASCQLTSCQLPSNSAETSCTTSPEEIEVMKLEGYSGTMCNKHVHSTMTRSSRSHCPTGVINRRRASCGYHLYTDDLLWRN